MKLFATAVGSILFAIAAALFGGQNVSMVTNGGNNFVVGPLCNGSAGTSGQILTSGGAGNPCSWASAPSSASVGKFCGQSTFSASTSGTSVTCSFTPYNCLVAWRGAPSTSPANTAVNLYYDNPSGTTVTPQVFPSSTTVTGVASVYCSVD